jgi:DNA polymerase III alpha subunit (gram-positive type)
MYLFIDTETGGLTPKSSLLTVSCIAADRDFNVIPIDDCNPGLYMGIKHEEYSLTAGALSVNKINLVNHHAEAVSVADARYTLMKYIRRATEVTGKRRLVPAGHNVSFDVQFLRAYLIDDNEWDQYFTYPAFDTAAIARFFNAVGIVGGGYSLTSLRNNLVPHVGALEMHDAETDNLVAIELAKKFVSLVPQQNK